MRRVKKETIKAWAQFVVMMDSDMCPEELYHEPVIENLYENTMDMLAIEWGCGNKKFVTKALENAITEVDAMLEALD